MVDPEITCPSDITEFVNDGTDTYSVSWTVPTPTDDSGTVSISSNLLPGASFTVGTTTQVTYTATDGSGNTAQCSFSVTVTVDNENPELVYCPNDIVQTILSSSGATTATVSWTVPIFTDNSGTPTVMASISPGSTFTSGNTVVVYTASDSYGNVNSECTFTVTVNVDDPPVFTSCPSNQVLETDAGVATTTATWTTPTAQDAIDGAITPLSDISSGSSFSIGTTEVVYTAVDMSANSATCEFSITVNDNEDPVFDSAPVSPVTASVYGQTSTTVSWTEPVVTDNSGEDPTITLTGGTNGGTFNVGTTSLIYTATDGSNNQA
ncbi:hyalin-like, partial [Anneissia japonica]|uniref:hyalin-like n=1 Tax=Anneissia japonica TaxID=1529436 RepID=UPI00142563B7